MRLTELHVEAIRVAAERIGEFGKIVMILNGGTVDIITEERRRIQDGRTDRAGNSGHGSSSDRRVR